jgi:uncharacterized protein (DUF2249 family)
MNQLELATSRADAEAVESVRARHARLVGALTLHVDRLVRAAATGDDLAAGTARTALVEWCDAVLAPHALAEEELVYPAARAMAEGRLLVEALVEEGQVSAGLVRAVADADTPVVAAAAAHALRVLSEIRLAKIDDLVLPLLAAAPEVFVAALLAELPERSASHAEQPDGQPDGHPHEAAAAAHDGCGDGHACACGEVDGPGFPELDARTVPHAIRHATVFGALEAVRPGGGLVLVAPHDPLPLLAQVQRRFDGGFEVRYLERGPEAWRLVFLR